VNTAEKDGEEVPEEKAVCYKYLKAL